MEEAERKAREEAELKVREEEERKAKEELERKAAEAANSATGQVRASLAKDSPEATVKLLNSFPVESGSAQRMSYLMEVGPCSTTHRFGYSKGVSASCLQATIAITASALLIAQ